MKDQKSPTIRTVAEYVNLSPTTVSLALRGDESIPPETRDRVIAAARELNYTFVPRKKKVEDHHIKRLVYVTKDYGDQPVLANPFYGEILRGVEQVCRAEDVALSLVVLPHDYSSTAELPVVLTRGIDGVIVSSPYLPRVIDRIAEESRCPVVLVDNTYPGSPYDTIMSDDYGGCYLMTCHLLELGHRHIQFITGRTRNPDIPPSFRMRYHAHYDACQSMGITPLPAIIGPERTDNERTQNAAKFADWLAEVIAADPQITAFIGASDMYCFSTVQALQELGYQVPRDFSVAGYDDSEMSSLLHPPLSTMRSKRERIGQIAARRLLARIEGDDSPPLQINVGVELVLRASTGPVRQ